MKKTVTLFAFVALIVFQAHAVKHTITYSGFNYSPATLTVHVGDTVTIQASVSHPILQVSKATWNANGTTGLSGGFMKTTKNYTMTVASQDTIWYICIDHVEYGMKGKIVVAALAGVEDTPGPAINVSFYPNPVSEKGTVKISGAEQASFTVGVFSISGQLQQDLSRSLTRIGGDQYATFDASTMPAGNYFVLATSGKSRMVKKFEVIR
jgi:plastocyanin